MNKTKIEWCDSTWNPVTGCCHDCEYCYARRIAERFKGCDTITIPAGSDKNIEIGGLNDLGVPAKKIDKDGKDVTAPYPFGFAPTFHRYKLSEPQKWKRGRNIFVCSMADLFGDWIPDEWIQAVFKACEAAPQHNYLFLTKNPQRYCDLANSGLLPAKTYFWYGSTITDPTKLIWGDKKYNTFLSIEPFLAPLGKPNVDAIRDIGWAIIGAETGNRVGKVTPKREWVDDAVENLSGQNIPIFMKDSLVSIVGEKNMLREFPEGLRKEKNE